MRGVESRRQQRGQGEQQRSLDGLVWKQARNEAHESSQAHHVSDAVCLRVACHTLQIAHRQSLADRGCPLDCITHEVGRIKPAAMPEQRKPGFRFVTRCNVNQELIGGCRSGFQLGLLGPAYKSVCNAS